jgi:hypothetical protein
VSKLSELLAARESPPAKVAKPANPDPEISNISKISRGATSDLQGKRLSLTAAPPTSSLATCATCMHYRARRGEQPDGFCRRYDTETWGQVEFSCPGFEPADEAVRAREARRAKVEAELRAHPELQRAFDVADAPLKAESGASVSVVLAVRHGDQILSGEVLVPREKWNSAALIAVLETEGKPQ